jgi:CheY-like chemotaxis protein
MNSRATVPGEALPRRVLVVEDNADAAESLGEILRLTGHSVEVALSGRAAVQKARTFHPDVVLCDLGLPELDGFGVAEMFRADPQLRATRLIALTGFVQPEMIERVRQAGFVNHLSKPADIEKLIAAVASV